MNEEGKSFFSYYKNLIFFFLLILSFVPYDNLFSDENISRLFSGDVLSENLIVFMSCAAFFGFLLLLSYLISGIVLLLVHLVLRLWFLYKLRKPVNIYPGEFYNSHRCDYMNKLNKIITSVKDFFKSKRWEDISFYLLCAFCTFMLLCFTYA